MAKPSQTKATSTETAIAQAKEKLRKLKVLEELYEAIQKDNQKFIDLCTSLNDKQTYNDLVSNDELKKQFQGCIERFKSHFSEICKLDFAACSSNTRGSISAKHIDIYNQLYRSTEYTFESLSSGKIEPKPELENQRLALCCKKLLSENKVELLETEIEKSSALQAQLEYQLAQTEQKAKTTPLTIAFLFGGILLAIGIGAVNPFLGIAIGLIFCAATPSFAHLIDDKFNEIDKKNSEELNEKMESLKGYLNGLPNELKTKQKEADESVKEFEQFKQKHPPTTSLYQNMHSQAGEEVTTQSVSDQSFNNNEKWMNAMNYPLVPKQ